MEEDFIGFDKVGDCSSMVGDISSVFARVENENLCFRITFDGMYSRHNKIDYFLNEVMLGNITSASDIIIDPLDISIPLNLDGDKSMLEITIGEVLNGRKISIDQWISKYDQHYLTVQSHTRDYLSSDKIDIYYKSYLIFDALGDVENSEKYINLCYNEIMNVSKSLRKKDKKSFLNNSVDIVNVIKIWKELKK